MIGRTKWFPRSIHPVRNGTYEVVIRLCPNVYVRSMQIWDGIGFLTGGPMVMKWRGITNSEHQKVGAHKTAQGE